MTILALTKNRRELVDALSTFTERKMHYQGPPTFAYSDSTFTIDRTGNLIVDDVVANVNILRELTAKKFIDDGWDAERDKLDIIIPIILHTPKSLLQILEIIWGKEKIINKAVGASVGFRISKSFIDEMIETPARTVDEFIARWRNAGEEVTRGLVFDEDNIHFTGFPYTEDHKYVRAFVDLAEKVCCEACVAKKVRLTVPEVENERYFFRTWLVRIGLVGDEYKASRKILLMNLEGNCAFKTKEQAIEHRKKHTRSSRDETI